MQFWEEKAIALQKKVDEIEAELEISSAQKKELEKVLQQADKTVKEFRMKYNRAIFDLDDSMEKITLLSKENIELHKELTEHQGNEKKLISYVRELEQKNDELESCNRIMMASVNDIEAELDNQIEKNALLDTELEEKDALQVMVQRLKDEQRDLQCELERLHRQRYPDNDRLRSPIDSNKLTSGSSREPQTMPPSPDKSKGIPLPEGQVASGKRKKGIFYKASRLPILLRTLRTSSHPPLEVPPIPRYSSTPNLYKTPPRVPTSSSKRVL